MHKEYILGLEIKKIMMWMVDGNRSTKELPFVYKINANMPYKKDGSGF